MRSIPDSVAAWIAAWLESVGGRSALGELLLSSLPGTVAPSALPAAFTIAEAAIAAHFRGGLGECKDDEKLWIAAFAVREMLSFQI